MTRPGQAGFTLLETLVALAILGLVNAGAGRYPAPGGPALGRRKSVTRDGHRLAFAGGPDSLVLVTPMPAHLSLGAYTLLQIDVVELGGRHGPPQPPEARSTARIAGTSPGKTAAL